MSKHLDTARARWRWLWVLWRERRRVRRGLRLLDRVEIYLWFNAIQKSAADVDALDAAVSRIRWARKWLREESKALRWVRR